MASLEGLSGDTFGDTLTLSEEQKRTPESPFREANRKNSLVFSRLNSAPIYQKSDRRVHLKKLRETDFIFKSFSDDVFRLILRTFFYILVHCSI